MGCGCAAPTLAHVNVLLTLYGGATLASAARLKWDPSTYIAMRELFPLEYRVSAVFTTLAGALLLLLPHLAVAGLYAARQRTARTLLYFYAGLLSLLVLCEVVYGAWMTGRILAWLSSEAAQQLQDAMELRQYLKPILVYFSRWHPLPQHIENVIKEAEEDGPRNMYVAGVAGVLLAVLQPLAVVLALLAARDRTDAVDDSTVTYNKNTYSALQTDYEKAPLRTAYKNGRIVVIPSAPTTPTPARLAHHPAWLPDQ